MTIRKVLTVFIIFLVCLYAQAQTGQLFNADKQLTSSFTNQVYLDRDGFIWVVTRNGLNKYDGYHFHAIKREFGAGLGMASNYINCMIQDANGLFYLGMYGALQTYDGNRFQDVEVKDIQGAVVGCYITCFLQRSNGELLVGTSGHGVLKIENHEHARQLDGPLKDIHTVNALLEDKQGHLWIAANGIGLIEYDGKTTRKFFTSEELSHSIRTLCTDKEGNIYVGTYNSGVFVKNHEQDFRHLDVTGKKPIASIYCRRDGRLMFGYDGQGVAIYDAKKDSIED